MLIRTSLLHQGFTLLSRCSMVFAFLLLIIYSSSFWFDYDASYFGPLAILLSLAVTHNLLRGLESDSSCKLFSFLFKGKPLLVYQHWLKLDEKTFSFGTYRLLYGAIDDLSLSTFGSLIFKSNALCGPLKKGEINPASIVLKVPFSAINLKAQKEFITFFKEKCPHVTIGTSLAATLEKPILKSTTYIQVLTIIIFTAVLLDVGHSTFEYIELLKRYHLSQQAATEKNIEEAKKQYASAEYLKAHCSKFSLVTPKLLNNSSTAASLLECRSKALWGIGKKQEALKAQIEAAELVPKSFKINLRLARLYSKLGQNEKANKAIDIVSERHKHALLPRLYSAGLLLNAHKEQEAKTLLTNYVNSLDQDYFTPPPVWPPAGEDALHELFVRDDLEFLLSNLKTSPANIKQ